jgi:RNA polymerase sigma factor (sigma-70 family)
MRLAEQIGQLRHRPQELIPPLATYVASELGRRVRMGQIHYEDLLRDEVVDSAFASALARLEEQREPIRDLSSYLRTRAQDMISREVRRIGQERRQHISLEQTVMSGDETEGGEEVRVADIIPDPNARGPEQLAVDNETFAFVVDILADVPDVWRTVFLQRTMQDRSAREVAELEGLDIDEVRRITLRTREYLRERFENEYDDLFDLDMYA